MHIEVWQSPPRIADQLWHWHILSRGRTVADAESFPTKQHAVRAAQAVVSQIIKRTPNGTRPTFRQKTTEVDGLGFAVRLQITWS